MNGPGTDPLQNGLAAGDARALPALYDRFAARLYRAALRILGRPEDAEDAVQDVFLALVRSRERLNDVADLSAYLFTALRHAAVRAAQRRAKMPAIVPTEAERLAIPVAPPLPEHPHLARLKAALCTLPNEQREVIALKIDGELTFAQIGEVLGVSMNTAASRYRYALQKLRASVASPASPRPSREGGR